MPSDLPDGWAQTTLGAIAILGGGTTPSRAKAKYWECGTVPWATPSDITALPLGSTYIERTELMVSQSALRECSLPLNPPNTVFMTSRASIGFAAINTAPMATNQGFITFTPNSASDARFIYYWLLAHRDFLVSAAGGSTFKELSRGTAKRLPITIPPLEEQIQIAGILQSVDDVIAANFRVLNQAENARQAILHASFGDSGWNRVPLSELGSWQSGGTPSKADESYWGGEIPWICPRDMKVPVLSASETTVTQAAISDGLKVIPKGTLLMVVRGMILAKAIPTAITAAAASFNQDIKAFKPIKNVDARFIGLCVQHQERELLKLVNTATHGTKKLDSATIGNIQIPLPGLEDQCALVETVSQLDQAIVACGAQHIRLSALKRGLAAELLSGRKRVPTIAMDLVTPKASNVQPAFKRAVLAAEVVHQLHKDAKFGSVKHEKIVHLCEYHADLHHDIDRHAYKKAAGPYDPKARRSVEANFKSHKWFDVKKAQGGRTEYIPMEKCGGHKEYFDRYFSTQRGTIQAIIDLLRPLDSQRCEIVATLYAVWNDYLLDGESPTKNQIVNGARNNWHASKQAIPEDRWAKALTWMREKRLVPKGSGEKTRVATA